MKRPHILRLGLLGALLVSVGLRCWQMDESLWLDELHTAWVVAEEAAAIPQRAAMGNQSPLYFYLPWATSAGWGFSERSLRLPSLLAGVATALLGYLITRRWTGSVGAALLVAMLIALDRNCIFYAQEARPYACVQLVGLLQLFVFWKLQMSPNIRWRSALVVSTILLFYLHYTALLLVAGELVWCLLDGNRWRGTASYRTRQLLADLAVIGLACSLAWPQLMDIAARRENWALFVEKNSPLAAARWFSLDAYFVAPVVTLTVIAVAGVLGSGRWSWPLDGSNSLGEFSLVICWFTVPVLVAWMLTASDTARIFHLRYLIVSAAAPMIFAGLCAAQCRGPVSRWLLSLVVIAATILSGGMLQQFWRDGRLLAERRQDWRSAARRINRAVEVRAAPVFVRSGFLEADALREHASPLLASYCLAPVTTLYRVDRSGRQLIPLPTTDAGKLSDQTIRCIAESAAAWFVINGNERSRAVIAHDVNVSLRAAGFSPVIRQEQLLGDIHVMLLSVDGSLRDPEKAITE